MWHRNSIGTLFNQHGAELLLISLKTPELTEQLLAKMPAVKKVCCLNSVSNTAQTMIYTTLKKRSSEKGFILL